jgi:integrase
MSVYLVKGKGWRYDFTLRGTRHTGAGFKTKREARKAEAEERKEANRPRQIQLGQWKEKIPIDMPFLDLVNRRLDYIQAHNSERYYRDSLYYARRWVKEWKGLNSSEVTNEMIEAYLLKRSFETSAYTANKELRSLRAMFNFGMKPQREWISENPTQGIEFFPVEKRIRYVPPKEDVLRVILAAEPDIQDYLWTIALTMGRMSEINQLTWKDVNLEDRYVVLYTRKKRGGRLSPRMVPMPEKLNEILCRRYQDRDKRKPWVFWHRYWDTKKGDWSEGPYKERKRIMKTLCEKARVPYFRFHALRHLGASILDKAKAPLGSIQRILGHENRSTTELYLHSIGEAERETMKILDREIEGFSHTNSHTKQKKDLGEIT